MKEWKGRGNQEGRIPGKDKDLWELIKTGAIIMAVILIIKIGWDLLSGLGAFLKRAFWKTWAVAKANAVVFVAIPLAIAALAVMFPESGRIFYETTDSLSRTLGIDDLKVDVSKISGQTPPPVDLTPLSDLRDCAITMKYSALESGDEQRCIDLCREREYTSYGIVKEDSSYDCYCCHGSGTTID